MFVNAIRISGVCALSFGLVGCVEMAVDGGGSGGPITVRALDANKPIEGFPPGEKRCKLKNPAANIWYKVEGTSQYEWCQFVDTSSAYQFAQVDMYYVPTNGGSLSYGYTLLYNCSLMESYIKSQIGNDGYVVVCALTP